MAGQSPPALNGGAGRQATRAQLITRALTRLTMETMQTYAGN